MKKSPPAALQLGFTLIELMVALAIGLVIMLALITLLVNVSRNNAELSKSNQMIENGRFALQLFEADIAHASYWAGFVPGFDDLSRTTAPADVPSLPDPCLAYSVVNWTAAYKTNLVGIGVQGYEIPSPVPSPTLSVCAALVSSPKANTDVLFVRHADNGSIPATPAPTDGVLYFQVERCGPTAPTIPYKFESDTALLTAQKRNCTTGADLQKFVSNLYYIRDYAVTAGDGIPTLMRSQFGLSGGAMAHQTAQPLIEGIEGFRVEYGIDNVSDSGAAVNLGAAIAWANATTMTSPTNRGDGIADGAYVRCTAATPCTADQMMNAVAVRVYVLVRNEVATPGYTSDKTYTLGGTTLGPFTDNFKRHLFTQTVRLSNVASRRETP